jgi:hypothetical protein
MDNSNRQIDGTANSDPPLGLMSTSERAHFEKLYEQVVVSYNAVRDMRTKLLAFLPLVSSGIFLLLTKFEPDVHPEYLLGIGIYGALIALGLSIYDFGNTRQLASIIAYGAHLEKGMKIAKGPFTGRHERTISRKILYRLTSSASAALLVYASTVVAWIGVAVIGFAHRHNSQQSHPSVTYKLDGTITLPPPSNQVQRR